MKAKLRTSEDVYHRLLWSDPSRLWFEVATVVVGYDDRFLGRREMELSAFSPGGDVPFHRVQYFRNGGKCAIMSTEEGKTVTITPRHWPKGATLLWSREGRIDRIFCTNEPTSAIPANKQQEPPGQQTYRPFRPFIEPRHRFQLLPTYRFDTANRTWQPSTIGKNESTASLSTEVPPPLTFVTYNVLDDRYPDGAANCRQRWDHIIELIATLDADVIALQEVTPRFLAQLSACNWVRSSYYLSDFLIHGTAHTLDPSGLLLLSKARPTQLYYREIDNNKQLLAVYHLADGRLLCVVNVHLTSDHHRHNASKRQEQLRSLTEACGWEGADGRPVDVVVLGDTNMQQEEAVPSDYLDSCDGVGSTYDPATNALAARVSRSGRSGRYDRVLVRRSRCHTALTLQVTAAQLIGCQPIDGLFLSDHYGVHCRTQYATQPALRADVMPKRHYPPVHTSAVVLLVPRRLWPALQSIRREHDPAFHRWPPHVNLLYGFAGEDHLLDACAVLRSVCAQLAPFTISLGPLRLFRHRTASTVYASIHDEGENVRRLQTTLQAAFPACTEQSTHSTEGFTPHCSVAKVQSSISDRVRAWAVAASEWSAQPFTVNRVTVLARSGDEPFRVCDKIPLGCDQQQEVLQPTPPQRIERPSAKQTEDAASDYGGPDPNWQADARSTGDDPLHRFLSTRDLLCSDEERMERNRLAQLIQSVCRSIVLDLCGARAEDVAVPCAYVVGSSGLCAQSRSSDIDVLACGPRELSAHDFLNTLRDKVTCLPPSLSPLCHVRLVFDALVPVAIISFGSLHVDVSYAQFRAYRSPLHVRPWLLSNRDLQEMEPSSSRAVCSILDMCRIQHAVPRSMRNAFITALQCVRRWADTRGLSESKLGYLGGHSYALLMTHVCEVLDSQQTQRLHVPSVHLLRAFFRLFSGWAWTTPVTIATTPHQHGPDSMSILSPSFPYRNTARAVSRSTLSRLRAEFSRAASLLADVDEKIDEAQLFSVLNALCQPPSFASEFEVCIELTLAAVDHNSLDMCCSFVESRLVELVADMDKLNVSAVPYRPTQQTAALSRQLLIGLSSSKPLTARQDVLSHEVRRFIRRCEAGLVRASPSAVRHFTATHRLFTSAADCTSK